jgi:hypothetical protein
MQGYCLPLYSILRRMGAFIAGVTLHRNCMVDALPFEWELWPGTGYANVREEDGAGAAHAVR